MSITLPLVSVIVTTKNEQLNITNCLEAIKQQTYPQERIEIIVVDNRSTDQTKKLASQYTKKIYNQGPERSAQRNFGAQKASGQWLLFLDADMILAPKTIIKAINIAKEKNLSALYIPEIVLGSSFWSQARRLERSFYDATSIDAVRLIKTDIFKDIGGFDLSLTGPEDWDLDKRIRQKGKVGISDHYNFNQIHHRLNNFNYQTKNLVSDLGKMSSRAVLYHNEVIFSLKKYLAKKANYSANFGPYLKKWPKGDPDINHQFGFKYRYYQVFWQKFHRSKIFTYPHLFLGVFLLKLIIGFNFLLKKVRL